MPAARLLSGVGAAMIMPVTLAVITSTFPKEQRGRAIGVWTGVAGGGGILGMFLSATLVDMANWRYLFVLPVALVLVALGMSMRAIPNSRETPSHPFDTVGALTSVVAAVGLIFALQGGPERGWSDPATLTGLTVGLLATAAFVTWELRLRDAALLDVRLFRERGLAGGSLTLLTVFGVQAAIFVVLFPFFQTVLGWSGIMSTPALMPMAVAMMMSCGLAPVLAVRIGARSAMATGILLAGAGLALMAGVVSVSAPVGRLPQRHRREAPRHPPGRRRRRAGRGRQRRRGRGRYGPAGSSPRRRRPAVLRRGLAAGHVGGRRGHVRPVPLRPRPGPEESGPGGHPGAGTGHRGPLHGLTAKGPPHLRAGEFSRGVCTAMPSSES